MLSKSALGQTSLLLFFQFSKNSILECALQCHVFGRRGVAGGGGQGVLFPNTGVM